MKRFLSFALGCLLLCTLTPSALANGWGLRGGVYDIVSDDDRYEGYTALADDGNMQLADGFHVNQAILQNRYHTLLISAARYDKTWAAESISTTAVYQPGDERGESPNSPVLEHVTGGFRLSYGDRESYTFLWDGDQYVLAEAFFRQNEVFHESLIQQAEGLLLWQANPADAFLPVGDALWATTITLDEFNITQTPRTLMEMRNLNMVSMALTENAPMLEVTGHWAGQPEAGMLPVYAAPDASSYRAASGKASVSLGGGIDVYGTAEGWTLIGYEVSPRTRRIGYVQQVMGEEALTFADVPLRAAVDTFLTDDPFVSQYTQAEIPAGATLTGLAQCGEYYAYVTYQAGETLYRGFVPMKDLMPVYDRALSNDDTLLTADVRWDVMDALCGKWYLQGGSYRNKTYLCTNGSFATRVDGVSRDVGNYRVYGDENGGFTLYMVTEANEETTYALTLNTDGTITLSDGQVENVYCRDEYSTYGNG